MFTDIMALSLENANKINLSLANTPINDMEPLGRYFYQRNDFKTFPKRVKWRAFMPNKKDLECSVARLQGLSESKCWEYADQYLRQNKTCKGLAAFTKKQLENVTERVQALSEITAKLIVESEEQRGPPRHANILGWTTDKDKQLLFAQQLELQITAVHIR